MLGEIFVIIKDPSELRYILMPLNDYSPFFSYPKVAAVAVLQLKLRSHAPR